MSFQRVVAYWVTVLVLILPGRANTSAAIGENRLHAASSWVVRANPSKLVNGAPLFIEVTPPAKLKSLTGTWLGHEIVFDESGRGWFALAGVSLETKPGSYPFILEGVMVNEKRTTFRKNFVVGHAKYPVIQLTVSKQFTEPNPEQVEKIKADQEVKHKTFSQSTPERVVRTIFSASRCADFRMCLGRGAFSMGLRKACTRGSTIG